MKISFVFCSFDDAKVRRFSLRRIIFQAFFFKIRMKIDENQTICVRTQLFRTLDQFFLHQIGQFYELLDGKLFGPLRHKWVIGECRRVLAEGRQQLS